MKKILLLAFTLFSLSSIAQVYPFSDDYESYTNFTTLGTQGGYKSDMSVYQTHGMGNSPKGLVSQISTVNTRDTLVSPLIGQVGAAAQMTFFYRIVNTSLYPSIATTLGTGDAIEVYAGIEAIGAYQLMYSINNSNHVTDTAFKKVSINIPGPFVGQTGNFKFVVKKGTATDYWVDIDSLRFGDSTTILPPTLTTGQTECICYGNCNGTVFAAATGGTPPYSYLWNTGGTNDTLFNLCANPYSVTVTDANGQSASAIQEVYEPAEIFAQPSIGVAPILCYGGTGCLNLRHSTYGGHSPYDYIWSNAGLGDSICGLTAGIYDVTILDVNNCSGTSTYTMIQPDSLHVDYTKTDPSILGSSDGSITVSVTGGAGYIVIDFNGGGFNTDTAFFNLSAGCYNFTIKDNNECIAGPDTVCLVNPPSGVLPLENETASIYPNPASDFLVVKTHAIHGTVSLTNLLGEEVLLQNIVENETRLETTYLARGHYILRLKSQSKTLHKPVTLY